MRLFSSILVEMLRF